MMTRLHHQAARVSDQFHEDDGWSSSSSSGSDDVERELQTSLVWLRDEVRNFQCTHKFRHDAAADLIHIYAYTKSFSFVYSTQFYV
ncbi:hypothetical protein Droror1_Dr00019672 [Drosera rotundifolia]